MGTLKLKSVTFHMLSPFSTVEGNCNDFWATAKVVEVLLQVVWKSVVYLSQLYTVWNASIPVSWLCFEARLLALSTRTGATRQVEQCVQLVSDHSWCQVLCFLILHVTLNNSVWQMNKLNIVFRVRCPSHCAGGVITLSRGQQKALAF